MSGVHGRNPSHGSASSRSPMPNASRASGSARASCTPVGGASRGAISTPVVSRRRPPSIGATTKPASVSHTGTFSGVRVGR